MKRLPNAITILRIVLALSLLLFLSNKTVFLIIYLACGASDFLDGYIARRFSLQTKLGAVLDSIADLCTFAVVLFALFTWNKTIPPAAWAAVFIITGIRVIALLTAFFKFRRFAMLHTLANKAAGALLVLYPVEYLLFGTNILLYPLFAAAFLSAAEECLIHIKYDTLDLNRKGLFLKH